MKTEESSGWTELVFENRNKAYGAYVIRTTYPNHVREALFGCLIISAVILIFPKVSSLWSHVTPVSKKGKEIIIVPSAQPAIEVRKKDPPVQVKRIDAPRDIHRYEVTNQNVTEQLPDPEPEFNDAPIADIGDGGNDGEVEDVQPVVEPPKAPVDWAEQMPVYEGGMQAMMKFIQRNTLYPKSCRLNPVEGRVFVRFVIDAKGKVTDVEIVKGLHRDIDKEAARVVALMSAWKPGTMGHRPVAVRMILPISFMLSE